MRRGVRLGAVDALIRILSAIAAATVASLVVLGAVQGAPDGARGQAAAQGGDAPTELHVEKTYERELSNGDQHIYQFDLRASEYASVAIEARGIHAVVALIGPDGQVISDFQKEDRNYGKERVEVVAVTSGRYQVVVKPALRNLPAGRYSIRLAEIRPATAADRDMEEARQLLASVPRLRAEGKSSEARDLTERALAIAETVRGPEDPYVAGLVVDLGDIDVDDRNHVSATSLYERAQNVFEAKLGPEHPATASVLERLGLMYWYADQRPRAERVAERALEVSEKTLGRDHPQVARCLITLGLLRHAGGDFARAEEIDRRAMAIVEKTLGADSLLYGDGLNNLAMVRHDRNDYEGAEALLRRSLDIEESVLGPQSYKVSITLQNLAILARQRKDYEKAEEYNQRVLAIRQRIIGPEHPEIAPILNNLALVYRDKGDIAKSLEMHFRALRIWEESSGPYSRGTFTSLGNIARTYAAMGDTAHAIEFQRRTDAVVEAQLALNLAIGSERQRLAFVDSISDRTDRTVSLNLDLAPGDPDANTLAALVLLQRKGRVLDAMTDAIATLRQRSADGAERGLLDQLGTTKTRLARVALNRPQDMAPREQQQLIKDLEEQKEKLEAEISDYNAEFRAGSQPVTLAGVQAAIPDRAALVEFAVFHPFDPKASTNNEAYGSPHYAAYVIRRGTSPHGKDLGPALPIDGAIDALRQALRDPRRGDVRESARTLDEMVLAPIREMVGGATRLLVSPDGALNLIPFEALVDKQGRYAVERYSISYLTSGRDLLRMQVARASRSGPIVVADPLFGDPGPPDATPIARKPAIAGSSARRSVTIAPDLTTMYFAPLAGTVDEARAIKALFPDAHVLSRQQATKSALIQVDAPRILHIATHGFFLQDPAVPAAAPASTADGTRAISASAKIANPLLRSGLALSGANRTKGATDDGILTALEASNLNLWGTKLVTLSACDTGVGEIRNGEGVYGLRRAFVLAGAETLVMSLWPVSDVVTLEMMTAYYTGLRDGRGRGDALRQAQLAMLTRKNRQHPFYWASFIQAGEWANLDGQR
jgi:CHAT domain-containing protein